MNVFHAVAMGLIEGATEFLPVSSTFHLIWYSKLVGLETSEFIKMFEVVIQSGAIVAVLLLLSRSIAINKKLLFSIAYSFIPTSIIGFLLYKIIKGYFFENFPLQLLVFFIVGLIFILFEKKKRSNQPKSIYSLTVMQALLIGSIQAFAVVPGVSRAGAVLIGLMVLGVSRKEAAYYSFLLAVPTITAASVYDIYKIANTIAFDINSIFLLGIGWITALISAFVVIRWFTEFLSKRSLIPFGLYRIVLAVLLSLILFFGY